MSKLLSNNPEERAGAIRALLEKRAQNENQNWQEPAPPPERPLPVNWALRWDDNPPADVMARLAWDGRTVPLSDLRRTLPDRLYHYMTEKLERGAPNQLTLIKIPAGAGKTYAAIEAAQRLAREGGRVLWLADRHDLFDDLYRHGNFDPALWYHWQGMGALYTEEPEAYFCRYHEAQAQWTNKGYSAYDMCWQLCAENDYFKKGCPFRRQKQRAAEKPIVFAMHNHMTHGLSASGFQAVIIDENPIGKLIEQRFVPTAFLDTGGAFDIGELTATLKTLAEGLGEGEILKGRALLDKVGDILTNVFEQIDAEYKAPSPPRLFSADYVESAPFYYLYDLLAAIDTEHRAWRAGWERWQPLVTLSRSGLQILQKSDIWDDLPKRGIVLDATANEALYRMAFDDFAVPPAIEWQVQRRGRVYQIVNRLNGKGSTETRPAHIQQTINVIKFLIEQRGYQKTGIITHKNAVSLFEDAGFTNVLHFGALRGVNNFAEVDALFVVGTPSPPGGDVINMAVVLSGNIAPLERFDDEGIPRLFHHQRDQYYQITEACYHEHEDAVPVRPVGGYWDHPHLQAVHDQYRSAEIRQAVARARPLTNSADIWLFSSVPIDMELDDVFEDPGAAVGAPDGIAWWHWVRLLPWLRERQAAGEVFGYGEIAEFLTPEFSGLAAVTKRKDAKEKMRRNAANQKWLEIIHEKLGGEIVALRLPGDGARGPAPKRLRLD